jgi:hypothetical protein
LTGTRSRILRIRRPRAHGARLGAALLLAISLVACGTAESGLERDTAHRLQEHVLGVSRAAAANDPAAALAGLDTLEAEVDDAARSGRISEDRRRSIMTSAEAVRADLTATLDAAAAAQAAKAAEEAAASAAAEASAAEAAAAEKAKADAESAATAEEVSTAPVVVAPPPMTAVPGPQQGRGNEGKGKSRND